ncbi:ATP-binding protein [uncultured Tenacibaculum sp.]|uniref:ATP-binding protein n=1 Tax=uncultured Tenacibaculum sp. TaxID=174713 RepID=UPI00260546A4|nr:ATP-binding protein [uncultured Tenacibaculum sp.]
MLSEENKVSLQTNFDRAHQLLKELDEQVVNPNLVKEVKSNSYLSLIKYHAFNHNYDSVIYYDDLIQLETKNFRLLGKAKMNLAKIHTEQRRYYKALNSFYEAVDYFKKNNDLESQIDSYVKLAMFYKKINSVDLSKEIDSVLMSEYLYKSKDSYYDQRILINHASFIASKGKNRVAVSILNKIDRSLLRDPFVLKHYYKELLRRYTRLNEQDSAKKYIKKAYETPRLALICDNVKKHIGLAMLAFKAKEYEKSLLYVDSVKQSEFLNRVEDFTKIKAHKVAYMSHKELGNHEKALKAYEEYSLIRNALKNYNINAQASILNFKLHYDDKILELQERNKMKDKFLLEKRKFYIFYTFLITFSVLVILYFVFHFKRRKERIQLFYEYEKIKAVTDFKNRFIENLSHEISTPVTIIIGYLRLIGNNPLDYSKVLKYTNLAKRSTENIANSLTNFLTLSKLEKEHVMSKTNSLEMGKFIEESVSSFQSVAEIKNIALFYKSNISNSQNIVYDYDSLKKIINNLVSNAIKYTAPKKSIHFIAELFSNQLIITVKDQGIGIDKEEQKLIFDRFYQSKQNQIYGGFGIGLSLVYELINKLRGTITLSSEKGKGSVFKVILPMELDDYLMFTDDESFKFKNITAQTEIDVEDPEDMPSILIVDDNIEIINYINELLSPSFNCSFAFDGKQAFIKLKERAFDLILSDLRMPVMNGYKLKEELNKQKLHQETPFVIMTTSSKDYDDKKYTELGINDYLIKPFKDTELLTRINYLIEKEVYQKQLQNIKNTSLTYNGVYADLMKRVNAIVLEHINDKDFSVNKLAKLCGYSHKQFTQIIKAKSGLSPVKLILEIRLLKAYDLILNNVYQSINEVIFAVGLNSRSYFNKVFTNRFGIKPGILIKRVKTEI